MLIWKSEASPHPFPEVEESSSKFGGVYTSCKVGFKPHFYVSSFGTWSKLFHFPQPPSFFSCDTEVGVRTKNENLQGQGSVQKSALLSARWAWADSRSHLSSDDHSPEVWAQCSEGQICLQRACMKPIRLFPDSSFLSTPWAPISSIVRHVGRQRFHL